MSTEPGSEFDDLKKKNENFIFQLTQKHFKMLSEV